MSCEKCGTLFLVEYDNECTTWVRQCFCEFPEKFNGIDIVIRKNDSVDIIAKKVRNSIDESVNYERKKNSRRIRAA